MRKKILIIALFLNCVTSFSQIIWDKSSCSKCADNQFVFDKTVLPKLEKYAANSSDYDVNTPEKKKDFVGTYIIKNENDTISKGQYLKISSIPADDRFIMIGKRDDKILIQNIKTKLFYVLNNNTFNYTDYSRSNENGYVTLVKVVPKELSPSEKELLARYKSLIKNADADIAILLNIQKKYLTKGYFDPAKVSALDKKTYNQKLDNLKTIASKLAEIDKYEDNKNILEGKLTTSELGSLSNINNWNLTQTKI